MQNRLRNFLAETASKSLNATVTIEDLEGNLLSDLTLRKIRLELPDTTPVLSIDTLSVRYLLPKLLFNIIHIDQLSINGLHLELVESSDGVWNLPTLSNTSRGSNDEAPRPFPFLVQVTYFDLTDAQITLRQDVRATSITANRLSGKFEYGPSILLSIFDSSLAFNPPEVPPTSLSGTLSFNSADSNLTIGSLTLNGGESQIALDGNCRFSENSPSFSFSIALSPLHISDLSEFFSLPGTQDVVASGTLQVSGTPNDFRHNLSLELDGAAVESEGTGGYDGTRGLWTELSGGIQNFNLARGWLPLNDILSGTVSTDFHVSATGLQSVESTDANASAEVHGPTLSGIPLDIVRFSASWSHEKLSIAELEAVSGRNRLNMSGDLSPSTRKVNAELGMDLIRPESLLDPLSERYPAVFDNVTLGGDSTVSVSVDGSLEHPVARFSITSDDISLLSYHADHMDLKGLWSELPGTDNYIEDVDLYLLGFASDQVLAESLSLKGDWSGWLENPDAVFSISATDISNDQLLMDALHLSGSLHGHPFADTAAADFALSSGGIRFDNNQLDSLEISANWSGPLSAPSGHAIIKTGNTSIFGERFTQLSLAGDFSPETAVFNLSADHEDGSVDIEGMVSPWKDDRKVVSLNKVQISTVSPWPASTIYNIDPLSIVLNEEALTFETCRLAVNDAILSLTGSLSALEARDLHIQTDKLEVSSIPGSWNDRAGISGLMSARVTLNGPWNQPVISSDIHVMDLAGYGISHTTDLSAAVNHASGITSVHASLSKQGTHILSADGSLPLSFSVSPFFIRMGPDDMKAELTTRDLRFSELPIPQISGAEYDALVDVDLSLSGNIQHPNVLGNISIRNGHIALTRKKLTYETIEGSILFSNDRINIDNLLIEGDQEGRLMVTGALSLHQGFEFDADLSLTGSNFYIPFQKAITARISPDLRLSGGLKTPRLTGEVILNESRLNLDRLSRQRRSEIQVVESSEPGSDSQVLVASQSEGSDFLSPLSADILVRVPKNAWLKGQDINAEISGEIAVSKEPAGPFVLTGPLNSLRGNYYFMGKNFQFAKGNLEFLGLKEINPKLDIEARTRIRSTEIIVTLSGSAQEITVDLDSDPPMEESDIISYLVFGRPTDNLGGDQAFSVEKAAMNYVGGLLAVEFRDLMGGVEFIDTFSIDPGSVENSFGSVTLGKYVTPELFISRSQSLSENEASYQEISYELTPSIKLESQIGRDYSNSVDLTWEFDF